MESGKGHARRSKGRKDVRAKRSVFLWSLDDAFFVGCRTSSPDTSTSVDLASSFDGSDGDLVLVAPNYDVDGSADEERRAALRAKDQDILRSSSSSLEDGSASSASGASSSTPISPVAPRIGCILCSGEFESVSEQRAHFRSDWHRWNLQVCGTVQEVRWQHAERERDGHAVLTIHQRSIDGRTAISEEAFEALGTVEDDLELLSDEDGEGVDSDEEEVGDEYLQWSGGAQVSLWDHAGSHFVLWKAILGSPSELRLARNAISADVLPSLPEDALLPHDVSPLERFVLGRVQAVQRPPSPTVPFKCITLLLGGGHFAGMVSEREKVIAHKCFHRYVVRKKAGGRQSTHDRTKHARSAGAGIRRKNEQMLENEIQTLVGTTWKEHVESAQFIFVHAPGLTNQRTLYPAVLDKSDPRVRAIAMVTQRPTLNEAKRVHAALMSVHYCPAPLRVVVDEKKRKNAQKKKTGTAEQASRGNDRESIASSNDSACSLTESTSSLTDEEALVASCTGELFASFAAGNQEDVERLLQHYEGQLAEEQLVQCLNIMLPSMSTAGLLPDGGSCLHAAAASGNPALVEILLNRGADPTVKDMKGRVSYHTSGEKAVRDVFRRYAAEHPDQWDWKKAGGVVPLTKEMEEKRKRKEEEHKRKVKEQQRKKKERQRKARELQREQEKERLRREKELAKEEEEQRERVQERRRVEAEMEKARLAREAAEAEERERIRQRELRAAAAEARMMEQAARHTFGSSASGGFG